MKTTFDLNYYQFIFVNSLRKLLKTDYSL